MDAIQARDYWLVSNIKDLEVRLEGHVDRYPSLLQKGAITMSYYIKLSSTYEKIQMEVNVGEDDEEGEWSESDAEGSGGPPQVWF